MIITPDSPEELMKQVADTPGFIQAKLAREEGHNFINMNRVQAVNKLSENEYEILFFDSDPLEEKLIIERESAEKIMAHIAVRDTLGKMIGD